MRSSTAARPSRVLTSRVARRRVVAAGSLAAAVSLGVTSCGLGGAAPANAEPSTVIVLVRDLFDVNEWVLKGVAGGDIAWTGDNVNSAGDAVVMYDAAIGQFTGTIDEGSELRLEVMPVEDRSGQPLTAQQQEENKRECFTRLTVGPGDQVHLIVSGLGMQRNPYYTPRCAVTRIGVNDPALFPPDS